MIRVAALILCATFMATASFAEVLLTDDEIEQLRAFGPWPPEIVRDPSNRVSGNPRAITLGNALFRDPILSVDGAFACAGCHDPEGAFTVPLPRAMGRVLLDRNSPSVRNLTGLRWFGWGGRSDTLWAASLHPIIEETEMARTANDLADAIEASLYAAPYQALFGPLSDQSSETVLVNVAKALAAYQETLITPRTPFDEFRDDLTSGDHEAAIAYPKDAQRGLKLFLGEGNCAFCHSGPRFTNNEFHDAGVPYFLSQAQVDSGRYGGLQNLLVSPYTLDSAWSDDPDRSGAWAVQNVRQTHSDFGTFRTPGLRGVAQTAPYMHDGSLSTLFDVADHYSNIDLERMHADGEAILLPLGLSEQEKADLVAFLQTLSAPNQDE